MFTINRRLAWIFVALTLLWAGAPCWQFADRHSPAWLDIATRSLEALTVLCFASYLPLFFVDARRRNLKRRRFLLLIGMAFAIHIAVLIALDMNLRHSSSIAEGFSAAAISAGCIALLAIAIDRLLSFIGKVLG